MKSVGDILYANSKTDFPLRHFLNEILKMDSIEI